MGRPADTRLSDRAGADTRNRTDRNEPTMPVSYCPTCALTRDACPTCSAPAEPATPANYARDKSRPTTLAQHLTTYLPRSITAADRAACRALADAWNSTVDGTPDDGLWPTTIVVTSGTDGATCIQVSDDACGYRRATIMAGGAFFDGHATLDWAADTDHLTVTGSRTVLLDT